MTLTYQDKALMMIIDEFSKNQNGMESWNCHALVRQTVQMVKKCCLKDPLANQLLDQYDLVVLTFCFIVFYALSKQK